MAGIERIGLPEKPQRTGNDWVYGTGSDGDVTISGTVRLTSDKYYNTLNVPLGNILYTNGYRVFVKDTATINGVVGIGDVSGNTNGVTNGTISGLESYPSTPSANPPSHGTVRGYSNSLTGIEYRTGGQGGGSFNLDIPVIPTYILKRIEAYTGIFTEAEKTELFDISPTGAAIYGGSYGASGSQGTPETSYTNANPAPPGFTNTWGGVVWNGHTIGLSGSPGSLGGYPPNSHTVNAPGGRGNPGASGTNATPGTPGTAPNPPIAATGGSGGQGGFGGGVVVICAKNITGTGKIISLGYIGGVGDIGVTSPQGPAGTPGTPGTQGATGAKAPDYTVHHHHSAVIHAPHACCTGHYHQPEAGKLVPATHHDHHYAHSATIHSPCCTVTPGHHYIGGAGGAGGAGGTAAPVRGGSPAVTGGTGKRGGAGGGGTIILITEETPSGLEYDVRPGTTEDADSYSASSGSVYVIVNE